MDNIYLGYLIFLIISIIATCCACIGILSHLREPVDNNYQRLPV